MTKIAIDMMGSDNGPAVLCEAVRKYILEHEDVSFLLFGVEETLKKEFDSFEKKDRVEIRATTSVIPMEIKPLDFLRSKTSSMYQAILAVKSKEADAVLSAGSTGGFLTGATILLRNIPGIQRAGLCTPFPTAVEGKGTVILDVGANNKNTGEDLYQFALMGRIYAEKVLAMKNPSVYTLSNGTEEGKGAEEVVEAYHLLQERNFPGFSGNVEARNALDGTHDIIVTSGFAGNIFLKATEGMASMMNGMIKASFKRNLLTKIGYLFSSKGFKKMKETMNYKRFGGAILLGVDGITVKAHGNSDAYAFYQAIALSENMVKADIVNAIKKEIEVKE